MAENNIKTFQILTPVIINSAILEIRETFLSPLKSVQVISPIIYYKENMKKEGLHTSGYALYQIDLPLKWTKLAQAGDYDQLYSDSMAAMNEGQFLSNFLKPHFLELTGRSGYTHELMLALREGPQSQDDEGIWHDDASRDLAFSLSLNHHPNSIKGGDLQLRNKDSRGQITTLHTQLWGTIIIFATGRYGWEHKVNRVTTGNRLVLVGWLTSGPDL
jgi:hypothetical protein